MTVSLHYGLPAAASVDDVQALYRTYDWWAERDREALATALRNTDELVTLYDRDEERLVAAARVVTDYVYYATVYDVIVADDRRGEGLGERLMDAVIDHLQLGDVTLSLLSRENLVEFYEGVGFEVWDRRAEVPEHGGEETFERLRFER